MKGEGVMSETRNRSELQGLYGALLGGLMASFVSTAVFWLMQDPTGVVAKYGVLVAVLMGLGCAVAFMVGGLYTTERVPWLGGSLLFASGFTALWSVGISFGAEPRWAVLVALGVAIPMGVTVGWRRFGHESEATVSAGEEAAWIH